MINIDIAGTGRNIKRLREARGISVNELAANFLYSTPQAIYNWQQGKNLPEPASMLMLGKLFGIPVEQIYCYTDDSPRADEPTGSSVTF